MTKRYPRLAVSGCILGAALLAMVIGCSKKEEAPPAPAVQVPAGAMGPAGPEFAFCDFKGGAADAAVQVVAYYPGRHEDTLAAVKALVDAFPGQVGIEIVDWRRPEGLKRRDEVGLSCAGVTINGKHALDIEVDGKRSKVLFVRGIDGEWTADDLNAAVRQAIANAAGR